MHKMPEHLSIWLINLDAHKSKSGFTNIYLRGKPHKKHLSCLRLAAVTASCQLMATLYNKTMACHIISHAFLKILADKLHYSDMIYLSCNHIFI